MIRLLSVLFLFISYNSFSQQQFDTEAKNNALPSSEGYKQRSNSERYEGLYTKKVSAQIGVTSLTLGKINYEMDEKEKLIIQSPCKEREIGVAGRSFGLGKFYRLDMTLKSAEKKEVPVKDVIVKKLIYADNLGIYGYIGNANNPTLYVPVSVSSRKRSEKPNQIYLTILPNSNMTKISWSYSIVSKTGSCSNFSKSISLDSTNQIKYPAELPIQIPLVFAKEIMPGTQLCIRLDMQSLASKEWENLFFRILLP